MDKASFETLFKELYVKLYYYALQLIHDEEASKDIVSGIFCELLEIYETLDSGLFQLIFIVQCAISALTIYGTMS